MGTSTAINNNNNNNNNITLIKLHQKIQNILINSKSFEAIISHYSTDWTLLVAVI